MQSYNVVIVGGGASGAMVALSCAQKIKDVVIIDSGTFVAKKLLVTGNGRCNITNTNMSSQFYNQNIDNFLNRFNALDTLKFFKKIGLETYADEQGRVYPISNSAGSVVDVIQNSLNFFGVKCFCNQQVVDVKPLNDGFLVTTDSQIFNAKKVVLCSGENSISKILNKNNIMQTQLSPSLVALKTQESTKRLSGVRVSNVSVTAQTHTPNGEVTKTEFGEVLFKDNGISGIVIFNLSSIFARNHNFSGKIFIDFLPNITEFSLNKMLFERRQLKGNILTGLLTAKLAKAIFYNLKLDYNAENSVLTPADITAIANQIKHFPLTVCGFYDNNQVFSGGVSLDFLTENLECKTTKNLYVCGELCDVDGECGGYNLQWAWTSGHIVGESLC